MRRLFPVLKYLWAGLIIFFTLKPGGKAPIFDFLKYPGVDKVGHFALFFVWSILFFPEVFLLQPFAKEIRRKFWIIAIISLLFGIAIEVLQSFIPRRSSDGWDLVADISGALAAIVVVKFIQQRKSGLE